MDVAIGRVLPLNYVAVLGRHAVKARGKAARHAFAGERVGGLDGQITLTIVGVGGLLVPGQVVGGQARRRWRHSARPDQLVAGSVEVVALGRTGRGDERDARLCQPLGQPRERNISEV